MHALLLGTALVAFVAVAWRLARRRPLAARLGASTLRGPRPRAAGSRAGGTTPRDRGVLVFEGLELAQVELDALPYPLSGLTTVAARGLYDVPCGRHRVRLRAEGADTPRTVDLVMPAGGSLLVSLNGELALVVRSAPRDPINASYIHYPTWVRGPLLERRARRGGTSAGLGADLARAFTSADRGDATRLAERLVGLALTREELDALRRACAEQVARAPAADLDEARARARLLLPEVEPATDGARPERDHQAA